MRKKIIDAGMYFAAVVAVLFVALALVSQLRDGATPSEEAAHYRKVNEPIETCDDGSCEIEPAQKPRNRTFRRRGLFRWRR